MSVTMQTQPILAAEFTNKSKTHPAELTINKIVNGRREAMFWTQVSGKREARKIAAERGATPWNF